VVAVFDVEREGYNFVVASIALQTRISFTLSIQNVRTKCKYKSEATKLEP
jgi:hypothetical protein